MYSSPGLKIASTYQNYKDGYNVHARHNLIKNSILIILVLAVMPSVLASTCQTISGNTVLDSNITYSGLSTCLDITGSNLILNCNGFSLLKDNVSGSTSNYAIYVEASSQNVTINNCRVETVTAYAWYYGICTASGSNNISLTNIYAKTQQYDILFQGTNNSINNFDIAGGASGIYSLGTLSVTVKNGNITSTSAGITNAIAGMYIENVYIKSISGNAIDNLLGNFILNTSRIVNASYGISSTGGNMNVINSNFTNITNIGFYVHPSSNDPAINLSNSIFNNVGNGFYVLLGGSTNLVNARVINNTFMNSVNGINCKNNQQYSNTIVNNTIQTMSGDGIIWGNDASYGGTDVFSGNFINNTVHALNFVYYSSIVLKQNINDTIIMGSSSNDVYMDTSGSAYAGLLLNNVSTNYSNWYVGNNGYITLKNYVGANVTYYGISPAPNATVTLYYKDPFTTNPVVVNANLTDTNGILPYAALQLITNKTAGGQTTWAPYYANVTKATYKSSNTSNSMLTSSYLNMQITQSNFPTVNITLPVSGQKLRFQNYTLINWTFYNMSDLDWFFYISYSNDSWATSTLLASAYGYENKFSTGNITETTSNNVVNVSLPSAATILNSTLTFKLLANPNGYMSEANIVNTSYPIGGLSFYNNSWYIMEYPDGVYINVYYSNWTYKTRYTQQAVLTNTCGSGLDVQLINNSVHYLCVDMNNPNRIHRLYENGSLINSIIINFGGTGSLNWYYAGTQQPRTNPLDTIWLYNIQGKYFCNTSDINDTAGDTTISSCSQHINLTGNLCPDADGGATIDGQNFYTTSYQGYVCVYQLNGSVASYKYNFTTNASNDFTVPYTDGTFLYNSYWSSPIAHVIKSGLNQPIDVKVYVNNTNIQNFTGLSGGSTQTVDITSAAKNYFGNACYNSNTNATCNIPLLVNTTSGSVNISQNTRYAGYAFGISGLSNGTNYQIKLVGQQSGVNNTGDFSSTFIIMGGTPPTITTPIIAPLSAYNNTIINATLNYSDSEMDNGTINFTVYKNGVIARSILTTAIANNTVVQNFSLAGYIHYDSIIIQAFAYDAYNTSSALNSSPLVLLDHAPVVGIPSVTPLLIYKSTSIVTCNNNASDIDGDVLTYSYQWFNGNTNLGITTQNITNASFSKGYQLKCQLNATDGNLSGTAQNSSAITVLNTAPVTTTPTVNPVSPTKLTASLQCLNSATYDVDNDTVTFSYLWYKNSISTGITSQNISSSYYNKGDNMICQITPTDTFDVGTSFNSTGTIIGNTPPSISNVTMGPTSFVSGATATCTVSGYYDTDGDSAFYYFNWYNGTTLVYSSNGTSTSDSFVLTNYHRNYNVTCSVTPFDGTNNGTQINTTTTVMNTLPVLSSASITPALVSVLDNLTCVNGSVTDADADAITYSYAWYKNSVLQPAFNTSIVSHSNTTFGESWQCGVTPKDPVGSGTMVLSNTITVGSNNTAPTVLSITPFSGSQYGLVNVTCFANDADAHETQENFFIDYNINGTWIPLQNNVSVTGSGSFGNVSSSVLWDTSAITSTTTALLRCKVWDTKDYSGWYQNTNSITLQRFTINNGAFNAGYAKNDTVTYFFVTILKNDSSQVVSNPLVTISGTNYSLVQYSGNLYFSSINDVIWNDGPVTATMVYVNDSNYSVSTAAIVNSTITIDKILPVINASVFTSYNIFSQTNVPLFLNISVNDTNLDTANYTIYKPDGSVDYMSTLTKIGITFTGSYTPSLTTLPGNYTVQANVYDLAGNELHQNLSVIRTSYYTYDLSREFYEATYGVNNPLKVGATNTTYNLTFKDKVVFNATGTADADYQFNTSLYNNFGVSGDNQSWSVQLLGAGPSLSYMLYGDNLYWNQTVNGSLYTYYIVSFVMPNALAYQTGISSLDSNYKYFYFNALGMFNHFNITTNISTGSTIIGTGNGTNTTGSMHFVLQRCGDVILPGGQCADLGIGWSNINLYQNNSYNAYVQDYGSSTDRSRIITMATFTDTLFQIRTDVGSECAQTSAGCNVTVTPTTTPSGGGSSSPLQTVVVPEQTNLSRNTNVSVSCGNNVCSVDENPISCPVDCHVSLDAIFSGQAWFLNLLLWLIILAGCYLIFVDQGGSRR